MTSHGPQFHKHPPRLARLSFSDMSLVLIVVPLMA